jgi:hypothetical protein
MPGELNDGITSKAIRALDDGPVAGDARQEESFCQV